MLALSFRLFLGIGLLLGGLRLLRRGLGRAARGHSEAALSRLTRTPLAAVVTGAVVTAAVQSSSAVTAMVVGLVDADVLDLYRAFGVIMGANLGTCMMAQVISVRGGGLAFPAVLAGTVVYLCGRRRLHRDAGVALVGLGCILWGVGEVQRAMSPLAGAEGFVRSLVVLGQVPLLGVLAGAVFTAVVQSSGAATTALIGLARQGLMDIRAAVAVALGSNVGTCMTTLLASVGASRNARTAALLHLAFNVAGVIAVLPAFGAFVGVVEALSPPDVGRGIANAHALFNLLSILVVLPWSRRFVDIVRGGRAWTS